MIALPLLQYLIFYVVVNFNSILMSMQKYAIVDNKITYVFEGNLLDNYVKVFNDLFHAQWMGQTLTNSFIFWIATLLIVTPLALFFSFYITKKYWGSQFFRVILYMPSLICSIVVVYIYQVLVDNIFPDILIRVFNYPEANRLSYQFYSNVQTRFTAILVYNIFFSFGANVLMYSGAMSGVSKEMIEASHIDGCGDFKEFIFITLPCVYPTLTTFIVVGIGGFFTHQMGLYEFEGKGADSSIWTLGYFIYKSTVDEGGKELYPYLSALGVIFTLVAAPLSLLVKYMLEKFGPSEN